MEIDKKIIGRTLNCTENCACLTDADKIICEVESNVNNELLFVKCVSQCNNKYKDSFGFGHICNCPVRKEIFRKYEK